MGVLKMEFLLPLIAEWAKGANPAKFGENLTLFFIAYSLLKREMRKQFDKVAESIKELNSTMKEVETAHSRRLDKLEIEVQELKQPNP